jgi:hypothetical protein
MKHNIRTLLLLAFIALVLTACGPCTEIDLYTSPTNTSPPNHSLVGDLRPVLTWDWSEACSPTEYIINLWTNATNGTVVDTGFGGTTGDSGRDWSPSVDLTPGTAYLWQAAAMNGTMIGTYSPWWEFIVGPSCETASLIAPDPVGPTGNISTLDPTYIWDYADPACTPEGYALQVSTNSDFTAIVVNLREANPIKAWTPGVLLDDCDRYYWRVAAIDGPDDGPWSAVSNFRINAVGNCPCLVAELDQPVAVWPGAYEIVPDLRPVLEWSFPGSCEVGGFGIHLSTEHDFSGPSLGGGTGTPNTRWTTAEDLEPHTQYWWEVFAGVGTDFGEPSSPRSFFTGPECSPLVGMVAPELISPINGAQVTEGYAKLRYKPGPGGCIPDGYFVNLQTDPAFLGTNLLGEFFLPGTTVFTDPLEDCTIHYWKVAMIQGAVQGPASLPEWFYTNESGICAEPSLPPTPAPVPPSPPMIRFLQNAFCRKGPGTEYGTAAGYEKGQEAELIGRSEPDRPPWWMTAYRCWVSDSTGETSGPVDELPIYKAPPILPVCNDKIPSQEECEEAGGQWTIRPGTVTSVQYYCKCD